MGAYFAKSLKRQYAYANSAAIRKLDRAPLQGWRNTSRQAKPCKVQTAKVYKDSHGKKRYHGTAALKATEPLALQSRMLTVSFVACVLLNLDSCSGFKIEAVPCPIWAGGRRYSS